MFLIMTTFAGSYRHLTSTVFLHLLTLYDLFFLVLLLLSSPPSKSTDDPYGPVVEAKLRRGRSPIVEQHPATSLHSGHGDYGRVKRALY